MKAEQLDPVAPATCRLSRGRPALGASSATQAKRFSGACLATNLFYSKAEERV
jgi:hypothetical protein